MVAPGPIRRPLASLATFERTGRRPPGEQKIVRAYHNVPQAITVPRGLLTQVARLAPLRVIDRRLAFEPVDFGWRGELYPYQAAAAKEIYRLGGGVVVMCPGGGKTITGLALAATWGQPTLWLVHTRELARQAMDRARQVYRLPTSAYGTVIDGLGPGENQRPIFTVAMVQSLANNPTLTAELAGRVGTVIQDECFPAGTLVDGRPIEEIREGDMVWSYNEETGELARRRVVRAMKRPSPRRLVRFVAAGRSVLCTANHPVRTTGGWVQASTLKVGEAVFLLEGIALREGRISSADRVTAPSTSVYNLEIEGAHTYFANGVLVHNCHHTPAESFRRVVGRMPARYKLGLSATPDRTDGLGPLMEAMLGKLVQVPLKVLVDAGRVLLPRIELVGTSFEAWADGDERTVWNQFEALRAQDAERNRLIVALAMRALAAHRRVLILVTRRDHAHLLARVLTAKGAQAFAATGEAQETQRARWFGLLQEGRCIVIATRLADEGLDLPRLDTLILAAAASSKVRLEQQIGRVMRTAGGKKDAIVYDLCDTRVPTYRRQVKERLAYYREVGYETRGWTTKGSAHE